ncbi:MAG: lysophospholipid acyltransferase family protein [Fibrobacterota bacterium]
MLYSLFAASLVILYLPVARLILFGRVTILRENETTVIEQMCLGFARLIMGLTRSELVIEGLENLAALPPARRVVLISNHESNLDIPCVFYAIKGPVGFIAKRELGRFPFLRYWIQRLGGVMLDRRDLRASLEALSRGFGRAGTRYMLIFPEGTRNHESTVAPFKPGSLRLAFENDAMVLPLCVCGGRRKFEGNHYRNRPGKIYMRILKPRDTRTLAAAGKTETARELHAEILETYRGYDTRLITEQTGLQSRPA